MRDQAGRNGETGEARVEPGTGKANCKAEPGREGKEYRQAQ